MKYLDICTAEDYIFRMEELAGIEIDPVYYKAAVNRFSQYIAQGRLF